MDLRRLLAASVLIAANCSSPARNPRAGEENPFRDPKEAASRDEIVARFFAARGLEFTFHDLNSLVAGVEPMLRRLLVENVALTVSLTPDIGLLKIDATHLEQILVNLVVNARDAMPRGGKLTIDTSSRAPDGWLALSVTDTGSGMNEATRARIFQPFFTTKGVGGTGLGLATVERIVTQWGGSVDVISLPGHGTTFTICFPRASERVLIHPESVTAVHESRGSETVLVAEDDAAVRLLARLALQRSGYQVLEAGNSQEAIVVAQEYANRIHLLLSDVIMPESAGAPLIERLRSSRPDLRVLYMSGYTDDAIIHHGVLDEGIPFLQKPFTPHALAQKVREVLDHAVLSETC